MAKKQRFILLLLSLMVMSVNFISGHTFFGRRKDGAHIPYSTSPVLVRLKGKVIQPGVFAFPDGFTVASVMRSMQTQSGDCAREVAIFGTRLESGDVLEFTGEGHVKGITRMKANELMVLGIPLEPDRMDLEDWSAVPGIGPSLAKRIIDDRHDNGSFYSIQGILRVPGIGNGKFAALEKYF